MALKPPNSLKNDIVLVTENYLQWESGRSLYSKRYVTFQSYDMPDTDISRPGWINQKPSA